MQLDKIDEYNEIITSADELLFSLESDNPPSIEHAVSILTSLRNWREFKRIRKIAEELSQFQEPNPIVSKYYAQALVDERRPGLARDVLEASIARTKSESGQFYELHGLLGRSYKEILLSNLRAKNKENASHSINLSLKSYNIPYEMNKYENYYHGINVAALLYVAEREKIQTNFRSTSEELSSEILRNFLELKDYRNNAWIVATKAEAYIGLRDWKNAYEMFQQYVSFDDVTLFQLGSTLRQLKDVWRIQDMSPEGAGLLQILEANFLFAGQIKRPTESSVFFADPRHVLAMRNLPDPNQEQLQKLLGIDGLQTFAWYKNGLDRAASVVSISNKNGRRFGTGFVVDNSHFNFQINEQNERIIITNYHVMNLNGLGNAFTPDQIVIRFEAANEALSNKEFVVKKLLYESPLLNNGLDVVIFSIELAELSLPAIPFRTGNLPILEQKPRVYVIGYPGGREMEFSLQDNKLLDHEGAPKGNPSVPDRVLVHYFAPTEEGSSGSPVFDDFWNCIAVHHAGAQLSPERGKPGREMLNGKVGRYSANEGIWIGSVVQGVLQKNRKNNN